MNYIDPRHKLFSHLDRVVAWQRGEKPAPVTIEWDLSNRCNLGCAACHQAHTHTKGPWAIKDRQLPMAYDSGGDLADTALVLRGLTEAADTGVQGIVFAGGGEPTTHPNWLLILAHAKALGLHVGMYTHGGLLTEKTAAQLAKLADWVVVSLDCVTKEAYEAEKGVDRFAEACHGLRWLAQGPGVVGASFLLSGHNWQQATQMLDLARSLKATYTTFRPLILTSPATPALCTEDRSWITAALPLLRSLAMTSDVQMDVARFKQYRDWTSHPYEECTAIRYNSTITPDGRVWLCPQKRGCQSGCIGDLRRESFADICARRPGTWTDFSECRVMCRLTTVNSALSELSAPRVHAEFI